MLDWLLVPLSYEFMRNALIVGILAGTACPVIGSYLIVQRTALLGEVIAHAVLPGLVIAFFYGVDILIGAFASGLLCALMIAWLRSQTRVKVDSAMALVFSTFLALGVLLISILHTKLDLYALMFGDILSVTQTDIVRTLIVTVVVLVLVKLFYKELLFYTFDPLGAEAVGLPTYLIYMGLMGAVTLTIIASTQVVGVILAIAMLVGPGITAYLLVKELHQMMGIGALFGVISSICGLFLSYHLNTPSGPMIVLVIFCFFCLALLFSPSQGILTRPTLINRLLRFFGWHRPIQPGK